MKIVRTASELRSVVDLWHRVDMQVGMVPTMGALHDGHLSLIHMAALQADRVVATLFVNPTQFGPNEDFDRYPRDEDADMAQFRANGVDVVFAPPPDEIYPPGDATLVHVQGIGDSLDGTHRPGFFTGVATVVARLFTIGRPDCAVFGEKDYQQLQVIRRMAQDLHLGVRVLGAPTIREADGLAMSSRNRYLSDAERAIAPVLHETIRSVAEEVASGAEPGTQEMRAIELLKATGFDPVDYVTVCDAHTLDPYVDRDRPVRVLAAAWLGETRLIDNV